jgi:3-hydroxyisobutyrate dehydrogenase-like beta-hydroxyacid dehydrogenase
VTATTGSAADQITGPVGVVGLGAMGGPIARHLLEAGFGVWGYDLDPEAVARLAHLGARTAPTLAELASQSRAVLVFVPTDADVLEVCDGGLLAAARPGTVVLVCSSVRPETCEAVAAAAPEGVGVLDAALTGGVRGAQQGRINLLVGGDPEVLDRVRPVLAPWTAAVHHLGRLGAGQVGKTVNNLIHWGQISTITEALRLGRAYGLPVGAMRAALFDGPTDSRTLRELEQMRFTWWSKDLDNAKQMAEAVGMTLPVAAVSREVMARTQHTDVLDLLNATGEPEMGGLDGGNRSTP